MMRLTDFLLVRLRVTPRYAGFPILKRRDLKSGYQLLDASVLKDSSTQGDQFVFCQLAVSGVNDRLLSRCLGDAGGYMFLAREEVDEGQAAIGGRCAIVHHRILQAAGLM